MISSNGGRVHARLLSYSPTPIIDPLDLCGLAHNESYQAEIVLTSIAESGHGTMYGRGCEGVLSLSGIPGVYVQGYPLRVGISLEKGTMAAGDLKPGTYISGILCHMVAETHRSPCSAIESWHLTIETPLDLLTGLQEETLEGRVRSAAALLNTDLLKSGYVEVVMGGLEKIGAPAGSVWLGICQGTIGGFQSERVLTRAVRSLDAFNISGTTPVFSALLSKPASEFPERSGLAYPNVAAELVRYLLQGLGRATDKESIAVLRRYVDEPQGSWLYTDESLRRIAQNYLKNALEKERQ